MPKILLATFGSLGDVYPYIAIARELQKRGHRAVVATAEAHRAAVEKAGAEFLPVAPQLPPPEEMSARFAGVMNARGGTKYLFEQLILPQLRQSYADLSRAAQSSDCLLTHSLVPAGVLAAQKLGVPWISGVVSPIFFYSRADPPLLPILPDLAHAPLIGAAWTKFLMNTIETRFEPTFAPVYELRAELGLPRGPLPLFAGQHAPRRVLALFSRALATPQADWPQQSVVTGFCELEDRREPSAEAQQFLQAGPPPLVFTLGASSTHAPGNFWEQSLAAVTQLGQRALLLTGRPDAPLPSLPPHTAAFAYEPLGQVLPRAAALIHHGGMGTIALALRAGVPQIIMPLANDQPDNAARIVRQGVAKNIWPQSYRSERVAAALKRLLKNPTVKERCAALQQMMHTENGTATAADEIEKVLNHG